MIAVALWSLGAICSVLALAALVFALFSRHRSQEQVCEPLLAAMILTPLLLLAEIRLAGMLPLERPVDHLPAIHCALLALAWGLCARLRGLAPLLAPLASIPKATLAAWHANGTVFRMATALLAAVMALALAYGLLLPPVHWDEVSYHLPMAVQMIQDGRLGFMDSSLPWIYSYPRGVEILWGWSMAWNGSDVLIHAVQWWFGVVFLLGMEVLSRRMGVPAKFRMPGLALAATMPVFFLMSTIGYNDLAYAGCVVAMLAFLCPEAKQDESGASTDLFLALSALALAMEIKYPFVAGFYFIAAFAAFAISRRETMRWSRFFASRAGIGSALVLGMASSHYLNNYQLFKNPLYPLKLTIMGRTLFPAPHPVSSFCHGLVSGFGDFQNMGRMSRFLASWAEVWVPLTPDSLGGLGPVVPMFALGGFAWFLIRTIRHPRVWNGALCLMVVGGFFIPLYYLPRYGLPMAAIMIIAGLYSWSVANNPAAWRVFAPLFLVLAASQSALVGIHLTREVNWICQGNPRLEGPRLPRLEEKTHLGVKDYYPTPDMLRAISEASGPGKVLAYDIEGFLGHLWNREYSNRVVFLPATERDRWPYSPCQIPSISDTELNDWLERLGQLNPDHVLLYARSKMSLFLANSLESGYIPHFTSPDTGGDADMTLFKRRTRADK